MGKGYPEVYLFVVLEPILKKSRQIFKSGEIYFTLRPTSRVEFNYHTAGKLLECNIFLI